MSASQSLFRQKFSRENPELNHIEEGILLIFTVLALAIWSAEQRASTKPV